MNSSQLEFVQTGGAKTQTARFIQCLMDANGQWVSLLVLVGAGCGYACHSRASDARRMGYDIQNRVVFNKTTKLRESYYRVVP